MEIFNDALNTFYSRLYGVGDMVRDNSDNQRRNSLLPLDGLLFPIISKGSFYMRHSTDRIAHTTAFVTPVVELDVEREIGQWVNHEGSIRRCIALEIAQSDDHHVCGMVHIKDALLLIEKSSPCSCCSGFHLSLSGRSYTIFCPTPHNRKIKCVECVVK